MKQLERTIKAMANRRRLAVVKYLKQRRKATVNELSHEFRISFKATSKHLGILAAAGIVDREQVGLNMLYSLAPDMPAAARAILSHL